MHTQKKQIVKRWMGLGPSVGAIFFFMILPIAIIAVFSFMEANPYGGVRPHLSFDAYIQFLYELDMDDKLVFNSAYLKIFARSFALAAMTTILCLLIGFPTAYYIAMQPPSRRKLARSVR